MTEFIQKRFDMPPMPQAQLTWLRSGKPFVPPSPHNAARAAQENAPTAMLVIHHLDVLQWSAVPFVDERLEGTSFAYITMQLNLPRASGVYAVLDEDHAVLYIGRAQNLKERWNNHQLLPALRSPGKTIHIAYLLCPRDELNAREDALIQTHRPPLNRPWRDPLGINPGYVIPPHVHWQEIACLGNPRTRHAAEALQNHGPCPVARHQQDYVVICTECLESVWCTACMPRDAGCECWKDSEQWPWASADIYDALVKGVEAWIRAHPEQSIWDIDAACLRKGGNRIQFAAFMLGMHCPSLYEAEIFANVLDTNITTLEQLREDALARQRKDTA